MATYKLLPDPVLLEEWESPEGVRSIWPTPDGQVWVSTWDRKNIALMNMKGTVIQEVKHKAEINDISLSPTTNTLWICDKETNILELVSGQLQQRFSTKVVDPSCICVTTSNHVIVGMPNRMSKFTIQGPVVFSVTITETGEPLVCSPYRITECPVTQNLAVIDWDEKRDGGEEKRSVVIMDSDLKKLFVYRGEMPSTHNHASNKGAAQFWPWGVVYDNVGNIIIGDYTNKRVLLLSGGGEFLRTLHIDKGDTWTVGVDRENILWAAIGWKVKQLQYISESSS